MKTSLAGIEWLKERPEWGELKRSQEKVQSFAGHGDKLYSKRNGKPLNYSKRGYKIFCLVFKGYYGCCVAEGGVGSLLSTECHHYVFRRVASLFLRITFHVGFWARFCPGVPHLWCLGSGRIWRFCSPEVMAGRWMWRDEHHNSFPAKSWERFASWLQAEAARGLLRHSANCSTFRQALEDHQIWCCRLRSVVLTLMTSASVCLASAHTPQLFH